MARRRLASYVQCKRSFGLKSGLRMTARALVRRIATLPISSRGADRTRTRIAANGCFIIHNSEFIILSRLILYLTKPSIVRILAVEVRAWE